MQEPQPVQRRVRRSEVGGIGLGRVFVPWSTVALALVVVMGVGGLLLTGGGGDEPLHIDAAAADRTGDDIPDETFTDDSSTSTTSVDEPAPTTPRPSTTSTTKQKPSLSTTTATTVPGNVSTTVTTHPTSTTVDTAPKNPVVVLVEDSWAGAPAGVRRVVFSTVDHKVYPGLRVWFRYRVKGGTKEFIAVFGQPRTTPDSPPFSYPHQALYEFPSYELDVPAGGVYENYFQGIVGWEWDGGEVTPPPAVEPAITLSLVRVDRCAAGENCLGYRFESDRPMTDLRIFYRVKQGPGASDPTPNREVRIDSGTTVQTTYYAPSQVVYSEDDAFPGLDTVIGVTWLGGSYDGSRVRVCTSTDPC